jgi:hypothetical protein
MNRLNMKFGILLLTILLLIAPKDGIFTTALASQTATPTPQEVNFPELTGPYKVGLTSFEWVDQSRDETLASIPGLKRDLMVYIWFPATLAKSTKLAPYMQSDLIWDIFSKHPGLGSLVHSHAYRTTLLNPDKPSYPVLIFEPCVYCISLNYASIIEDIASHGYIVIGMSHPYSTGVINYPDGCVLVGGVGGRGRSQDATLLTVWTQDIGFVLDEAAILNTTDAPFKGLLDLTHVGVFGHGFGGIASAQAAGDARVKVGADLDGGISEGSMTTKPFLFIGDNRPDPNGSEKDQDNFAMTIDGVGHLGYGDLGLLLPLIPDVIRDTENITSESLGSINPARGIQIVNSYLLAFFDHYLKGSDLKWPIYDEAKLITVQ